MVQIFNFFGNILGYLLWFFYIIVRNYGVAIILFTIILKLIMFPFSIKQQKSMAAQGKLAAKQKELQKKYGDNKVKYNEELQNLYQKEGINPASGCLTTLIPFPIMLGLYYAVVFPLKNVLHISADVVQKASDVLVHLPGIGSNFAANNFYSEIEIVKHFSELKPALAEIFTESQLIKIEELSNSFQFLGLDLLGTPKGSAFSSMLWLIPVLCLVSAWAQQFYMTKRSPGMQQQQGCMKYSMFLLPLISVYFSYVMPAAIGFYWVLSSLTGFVQSVITNVFYGPAALSAKAEAQRAALRVQEEAAVKPLPYAEQKALEEKYLFARQPSQNEKGQKKNPVAKQKKKTGTVKKSDDYLGSKNK